MDKNILLKSKKGDTAAISKLVKQFEPAVYKYSLKLKLKGFDPDDLYQEGSLSIIKAISKINTETNSDFWDLYVLRSIKKNFANLIRQHNKNNDELSLNVTTSDNTEILDLLNDDFNMEDEVIKKVLTNKLRQALNILTKEELELIYIVFYENKGKLRPYLLAKAITRREGEKRLNNILQKLRNFFK